MDVMKGMNSSSSLSISTLSTHNNETGLTSKIYVFPPVNHFIKITLLLLLISVGVITLVGNVLILCFLRSKKKSTSILRSCSFQKNFDAYISSLAVSDALCAVIAVPVISVELYFHVFQQSWGCKIARYVTTLFSSVTINNLMVLSIGKYFSTREVPRIFKYSTVKKQLCFAWLSACIYVLVPAATCKGIRYDLNDKHYTLNCKYDNQYLPFKAMFLTFVALQIGIPCIVILSITVCLILTVRSRMKKTIDILRDNAIKVMKRAAKRRATMMSITILLAFIIPYLLFVFQLMYRGIVKGPVQVFTFETDFVIRYVSIILAYSNGVINVTIYILQMRDFRHYLKRKFRSIFVAVNPNSVGVIMGTE